MKSRSTLNSRLASSSLAACILDHAGIQPDTATHSNEQELIGFVGVGKFLVPASHIAKRLLLLLCQRRIVLRAE